MTSSDRQKKSVLIAGIIAMILFFCYMIFQNLSFKTEWMYEEYNDGYRIISYTQAFDDHTTEIIIPDKYEGKNVIAIDDKVFYKNTKLKKVVIPDTIIEMGASVFKECKNLEAIEFGTGLTVIGGECFKDCVSLKEAILPEGITEIRGEAFMGCISLRTVELPKKITEIKGNLFENCSSLEFIEIPSGVTRIAAHAFYGCKSLASVYVPDTVNEIGSSAFRKCDSLARIELPEGVDINERAFKESPTRLLKKQISDDLWDEILSEIQNKGNYDALYVIYDKAKGPEEILILDGDICIVDSIKYEEIMKEEFALREFAEVEELILYLEEAKKQGAQYAQIEFYTEIGSEKVGYPYFASSREYIDDVIVSIQTPDENDSFISKVESYDEAPNVEINIDDSEVAFDIGDFETYEIPDANSGEGIGE